MVDYAHGTGVIGKTFDRAQFVQFWKFSAELDTSTHYQEKGIAHFMDLQAKAAMYHRMKQQ